VMVMDHGAVIADDTAWALKESLAGDRVTLTFDSATDAAAAAARLEGRVDEADGRVVTVTAPGGDRALPGYIRSLSDAGLDVVAATHRQPTLDDVFLALTGRSLREEAAHAGTAVDAAAELALAG
ncbi:MAG: ABC transporter, partial [Actinomycetota bacterium]|nr:ABC transporter [Actinomycetota bacterium]